MEKKTTQRLASLRSLCIVETTGCPKRVIVSRIIRNGVIYDCHTSVKGVGLYKSWPLFKFNARCSCCKGTYGVIAFYEGEVAFVCMGYSCLKKLLK